jgi:pyruvate dehydrogenase E2 component (dihydrolipoamide acetyltransferase)
VATVGASPSAGRPAGDDLTVPFTGLRGGIARVMETAWQAPRVAMGTDVDMTRALERQRELRAQHAGTARISVTHLALRAVALALREHPRLNGHVSGDGVRLKSHFDLGLAVDVGDGILVPVVRGVDAKTVHVVAEEVGALADLARRKALPTSDMLGATFTLSTLGSTGVGWFTPILNPPQIGIVGLGATTQRCTVVDGLPGVAPMMTVTLIFDHRAVDGQPAGLFLRDVKALLEDPLSL